MLKNELNGLTVDWCHKAVLLYIIVGLAGYLKLCMWFLNIVSLNGITYNLKKKTPPFFYWPYEERLV